MANSPSTPPPKLAGVVPSKAPTPKATPATSSSVESLPVPRPPSVNGDVVIASTESISQQAVPIRHNIQLINRTDASQFFKYLMKCSCGCEARAHTEEHIRKAADDHLQRAFVVEHKWR